MLVKEAVGKVKAGKLVSRKKNKIYIKVMKTFCLYILIDVEE